MALAHKDEQRRHQAVQECMVQERSLALARLHEALEEQSEAHRGYVARLREQWDRDLATSLAEVHELADRREKSLVESAVADARQHWELAAEESRY